MQSSDAGLLDVQGMSHLSSRRVNDAIGCFGLSVALAPTVPVYQEHLGVAYLFAGRGLEAEACFKKALSIDPKNVECHVHLACYYQSARKFDRAKTHFLEAISLNPELYDARVRFGWNLMPLDELKAAEAQAREAIRLKPNLPGAYDLLGAILAQRGKVEEAVVAYEQALSRHPSISVSTFNGIVSNKKITEADRSLIDRMNAAIPVVSSSPGAELVLQVSLGKALDDLDEIGESMAHFERARILAAKTKERTPFNRAEAEESATNFIAAFSGSVLAQTHGGVDSELPIFIIGMPRSGSTLLEQIISSHPQVGGAGELDFWRTTPLAADPRSALNPSLAHKMAEKYLVALGKFGPDKLRIIDKSLPNYALVGALHLMFPKARFIHCMRNPVDTCISILMNTLLLEQPPEYAYRFEDMVVVYKAYLRLMDHWRKALPPGLLLEVSYEELVQDREGVTRQVIEFCGLEWDEACLHHERNERRVKTPSKWQVRQPLYLTSIDRWKRYEPWIGPLADLLKT